MRAPAVQTGLARAVAGDFDALLAGRRVALLANPTAIDTGYRHALDLLRERFKLVALFGPEHGIRGDAQDMISVDEERDAATGLPVYSLYGSDEASLTPTAKSLEGVEVMVFDIQDVGSRYYTYVWTMVLAMRACAKAGVSFLVLDRPNPIDGVHVEGGYIEDGFDSFVGLRSLPNRHGLTAGEIAVWAAREEGLDLDLHIATMQGWKREMLFGDTGLPWVQPSPNMPTVDTALVYPGMCLVEGTELSEGRGLTRPFELAGAAFIDSQRLVDLLRAQDLPGVVLRPLHFIPTFHKFAMQVCGGLQQHVVDTDAYRPYLTGVAFVWAVQRLWPEAFQWRSKAYEFVADIPAFDLLTGSAAVREGIEAGAELGDVAATWRAGEEHFRQARESWLLYR